MFYFVHNNMFFVYCLPYFFCFCEKYVGTLICLRVHTRLVWCIIHVCTYTFFERLGFIFWYFFGNLAWSLDSYACWRTHAQSFCGLRQFGQKLDFIHFFLFLFTLNSKFYNLSSLFLLWLCIFCNACFPFITCNKCKIF